MAPLLARVSPRVAMVRVASRACWRVAAAMFGWPVAALHRAAIQRGVWMLPNTVVACEVVAALHRGGPSSRLPERIGQGDAVLDVAAHDRAALRRGVTPMWYPNWTAHVAALYRAALPRGSRGAAECLVVPGKSPPFRSRPAHRRQETARRRYTNFR